MGCIYLSFVMGGCSEIPAGRVEYSPPPGSSEADVAFLTLVHGHGITNAHGDQAMVVLAHKVCDQISEGDHPGLIADHWTIPAQRMSTEATVFFVDTSISVYCPDLR